jgi:hypothetical protein
MRRARVGSRWGGGLVLFGLLLAPTPSRAAEPTKTELAAARDLFARAERDEDVGRWGDALDKLRRASSVKMTPGIRFHIALCEEKLGQLVAALGDYNAAETAARSEGNKEVLDVVADPLASLRARIPYVTIVPPADTKNVEVTLDGGPLVAGLLGVPVPVEVGAHTIAARAPGHLPFSSSVTVAEKGKPTVEVRFPAAAATAVPHANAAPGGPVIVAPTPNATTEPGPVRSSGPFRVDAIATTLGAVAVVGFGVGAYFVAGGKQSSAETSCATVPNCNNLKGGVQTWDALALSAWVVGAGVGALSVYLWTRPGTTSEAKPTGQLRVGPGSLQFAGVF